MAHAFFGQQVDIAHSANRGRALQVDVVLLVQRDRAQWRRDAKQGNHGHVSARFAQDDVGHAVTALTSHEFDITTDQLGIGEADVVVGLQIDRRRGIGCAIGRQGEGVGTGHHVGVGAGGKHQVTAQVAQ